MLDPTDIVAIDPTNRRDVLTARPSRGSEGRIDRTATISVYHNIDPASPANSGQGMTVMVEAGTELDLLRRLGDRLRGVSHGLAGTDGDPTVVTTEAQIKVIVAELKRRYADKSASEVLTVMSDLLTDTNPGAYPEELREQIAAAPRNRIC